MGNKPLNQADEVAKLLGAHTGTRRIRTAVGWLVVTIVIVLAVVAYLARRPAAGANTLRFVTEEASRGDLVVTVSATGNLQPTDDVDVGSELSGIIDKVLVDDNDRVTKGQVLAVLDTSKLEDQVDKSKAALVSAEAGVQQAEATVKESRANLARLRQVAELSGGKVPSQTEIDTAEATLQRALANKAVAEATVKQARAALQSDETNLTKASIRAPMNGIVLERKIEPGQTVAAAMQAPVLFTLAQDLVQMELQVDVDEADVGLVRDGQPATFTVDAYPNRKYKAKVIRVNYGSQTKNNVISYKTILKVNNDDLSLRPGMTATAEITVANRENVLLVPNAALRFTPATTTNSSAQQSGSIVSRLMPGPPRESSKRANGKSDNESGQKVWILRDGQPVSIPVTVGNTDGRLTEISGGELKPGMQVIVEAAESQK
jgi:HlyD family secretion protein